MSKYTTELRWPIEQALDLKGLPHAESSWPTVYEMLGLSDYPIYDEGHRQELNDKIIRRYYFREIGFETLELFSWHVRSHMHEVMPYFNELYKTVGLIDNPLYTRDMSFTETWDRDETEQGNTANDGTKSNTSNTTTHSDTNSSTTSSDKNVFQDTPMNGLDTGAIQGMDYATNVTFDDGSTTGESEREDTSESTSSETTSDKGTSNRTGRYDGTREHRESGYDRPQAETLLTYRKAILNIDLDVVDSLNVLFMGLW